ncbi:MAG: low molecular weight phosphatase family protein [Rhizobiales bacterium]|nr:low molecular weight phosphatase family protein [Hyphomicrobiales bacterium]
MTLSNPTSVLFACNLNAIRSPMAEALVKHFYGSHIYVDSCGVEVGEQDAFATAVMQEMGIDLSHHRPKSFDELQDSSFDVVIALTPEALACAEDLARATSIDVEYWPTTDPGSYGGGEGTRESRLAKYRALRDEIAALIKKRFGADHTASA